METNQISSLDLEMVINHIPELETLIETELGFKPKLYASIENNGRNIKIFSGDLMSELGNTLVKSLFTTIKIDFWGGTKYNHDNVDYIGFSPKLQYQHPSGGSNGTDFIWWSVKFNLNTKQWITHN
jgi:hypothetical protein